nr:MAG TPA: hypothetical protein [Caudoviricetes sp.]
MVKHKIWCFIHGSTNLFSVFNNHKSIKGHCLHCGFFAINGVCF